MTMQDWLREQASHREGALTGDPIFARELRKAADRLDELEAAFREIQRVAAPSWAVYEGKVWEIARRALGGAAE